MDNPRPENVAVVDEVRQRFEDADAAILTEYRGLKVKDLAGLRRSPAPERRRVQDLQEHPGPPGRPGVRPGRPGAAARRPDRPSPSWTATPPRWPRRCATTARTNPLLVIKGGVLGDKIIDGQETAALAELPSREVLLARFAGAAGRPAAAARRAAAGPAPEPGLRPGRPPRPEGRGRAPDRCARSRQTSERRRRAPTRPPRPPPAEPEAAAAGRGSRPAKPSRRSTRHPSRVAPHPPSNAHGVLTSWQPRKRSSTASPT